MNGLLKNKGKNKMQINKLQKLQKHLRTLKLFKVKKSDNFKMSLPNIDDKTRFAMCNWKFDCGMPACVGGHAEYIFDWKSFDSWEEKFDEFFGLSEEETDWIISIAHYKSINPTPETAAKHIQDVLDGKQLWMLSL